MELNELLSGTVVLPSQPRAVALLMTELSHGEPNLRRLNQFFGSDPVLAARLLEEANSPAFEAQGEICGVPEALALLGLPQLQTLVRTAPLGTTSRSVPGVNLQQFWRYSLDTAKLARSLAGSVQQNPVAAYTVGLLHAVGELVIHLANPEQAQHLNSLAAPFDMRRARIEQRTMGYDFAQVSGALARRWGLPELVVQALGHQNRPFDDDASDPLAGVVHLAAWRARAREAELSEKELAVTFPDEVGLALALDIDMVLQQDPIDWTARPEDEDDYVV